MSEAGKVSLPMTPERIEEIKRDAQEEAETIYRNCTSNITNIELLGLLAALEESQQQNVIIQMKLNTANECVELAKQEYLSQCQANGDIRGELAEAQQTIARQAKIMKEAGIALNAAQLLAFFIEKDGKPVDGFRFREIARNMMTLLELMDWSALGNKEGEK